MDGEDERQERRLNIHFSPEVMAGVYANFANVSHSDYEFTITFARIDHEVEEEEVPGVVVSRVNLSPRLMRHFRMFRVRPMSWRLAQQTECAAHRRFGLIGRRRRLLSGGCRRNGTGG